jgi:2-octaprenyl-6-methoxyphenol hydroxylase
VKARTVAVDTMNRSLLSALLPVDFARGLGLLALANIGPLRRLAMRQGLGAGSRDQKRRGTAA